MKCERKVVAIKLEIIVNKMDEQGLLRCTIYFFMAHPDLANYNFFLNCSVLIHLHFKLFTRIALKKSLYLTSNRIQ